MRLMKPLELDHISQVLAKGSCPVCAFLKNEQAAYLRGGLLPEQVTGLCNFHAWALAAAVDREYVAKIFLNVLQRGIPERSSEDTEQCSFCAKLVLQEVAHIQELIEQMKGGLVRDWMKRQGTFCRIHAEHIRQLAPLKLQPVVDEILERSRKAVEEVLENLLRRTDEGKGTGGGVLGRAAEFLAAQRGIHR